MFANGPVPTSGSRFGITADMILQFPSKLATAMTQQLGSKLQLTMLLLNPDLMIFAFQWTSFTFLSSNA